MQDVIFLPAYGIYFDDLFDWSDVTQKCKHTTAVINTKGLLNNNEKNGHLVECNEEKVALFRHGNNVYAVKDKCPHAGGPLHLGDIEELPNGNLCVKCPWHSWKFDLETGHAEFPKGQSKTAVTYRVKVTETGEIYIGFARLSDRYFHGEIDF
ncbi:hypothetical protein LOTGIDRAFT_152940 [Lottia gigantea]|uniref:Rieske domain-containing protein n=1 Tax=Lottia gigantea TaxID=225164 RepID=V4AL65_LOTGI|nr:hypothetical protein LOTGIDRAFT_152940 [Lottia gigantea]ESO97837.1 hypothetical protein LOTGIDRAFT_152940 [Lottia gigantea]